MEDTTSNNRKVDKYYTPTLDEFFIGFEYEGYRDEFCPDHSKEWIDLTFGRWTSPNSHKKLLELVENNKVRVKFLDKEDIESLGFVESGETDGYTHYSIIDKNVSLFYFEDFKVEVHNYLDFNPRNTSCFKGNIKNKSELVKLLKQLNIN